MNVDGSGVVNLTDNVGINDMYASWGGSGDDVAPVLTVPDDMSVEATAASGATVNFVASAIDAINGPVPVSCTRPNPENGGDPIPVDPKGSLFPLGTTTVTCTATDNSGNIATDTFKVSVVYPFGNGSGGFVNQESPPVLNTVGGGQGRSGHTGEVQHGRFLRPR